MRPAAEQRRADLTTATLRYLARHGLDGFSLRGLAAQLGTSARMLVHYFGTKEALLDRAFAEHRRLMLTAFASTAGADLATSARQSWHNLTAPEWRDHYAVMFALMAASLADDHPYRDVARHCVTDWINAVTEHLVAMGHDPHIAARDATVVVSGLKGIALDLMVTDDQARCGAAAEALIAMSLRQLRPNTPPD